MLEEREISVVDPRDEGPTDVDLTPYAEQSAFSHPSPPSSRSRPARLSRPGGMSGLSGPGGPTAPSWPGAVSRPIASDVRQTLNLSPSSGPSDETTLVTPLEPATPAPPAPPAPSAPPAPVEEIQGGATIAAAVSGAAFGVAAGATLGPIGAAVGGILGATVGAFVGVGLEDVSLIVAERDRASGEVDSPEETGESVNDEVDKHPASPSSGAAAPSASCTNSSGQTPS